MKRRGRPKGSKTKRSPTPEGDLPPEERYFFQNRPGPPQISSNTLASLKLLSHDEYFEQIRSPCTGKILLGETACSLVPTMEVRAEPGLQCLLVWLGSKRHLVNKFTEWLHGRWKPSPKIVIVNSYTPKLNLRNILAIVAQAVIDTDETLRLVGLPQEMLNTIFAYISSKPLPIPMVIMSIKIVSSFSSREWSEYQLQKWRTTYRFISGCTKRQLSHCRVSDWKKSKDPGPRRTRELCNSCSI
jgi:origin recognition complex subunit 2